MVNQYGSIIQEVHKAARIHTQLSKGTAGSTTQYRLQGGELPVKSPELTSELLHCLSTLPDPCHGQDHYRYGETKPVGLQIVPALLCWRICQTNSRSTSATQVQTSRQHSRRPENPSKAWGKNDWIPGWMVGHLPSTSHTRIGSEGTSSFLYVPQRLLVSRTIPRLEVTASLDRSESYTRVIDGQVRCITPEIKPQNLQVIWNVLFITVFVSHGWSLLSTTACAGKASRTSEMGVQSVRSTWFEDFAVSQGPGPPTDQGQPNRCMALNWLSKKRRYRWKNNQNSQH